jgi:hypothetical protein
MAARSHQNRKPGGAMGEALHGGHEMLNHLGRVIRVTRRTIRALDMRRYLRRDRRSGFLQLRRVFMAPPQAMTWLSMLFTAASW